MARSTNDLVDALSPLLEARGLDLVDVELHGSELTIFVDREIGVDLDTLGELDPLPGRYTLSVSSPVLERRLRTPAHFVRAVGEAVTVRVHGGTSDVRRVRGTVESADETGFTLVGSDLPDGSMRIAYSEVERARTIFEWGPQPKRVRG